MKDILFNASRVLGRTRYPWVDYARGITIILVVYRHIFEGLAYVGDQGSYTYPALKYSNIFFFSFRMPLFFMVSGMFLSNTLARNGMGEYIKKRFSNIFYPLLIWGSIQVSLQLLFANYVHADRVPMDYLNLIINPRRIEQFWYLNALFFVGVLYVLVRTYLNYKPWQQLILGLLFFIIAAILKMNAIEAGFIFDILFFYIFFAIGDVISRVVLHARNYSVLTSPKTMLLILPVFVLIQYYFTEINLEMQDDYYVQYTMPWLYVIAALAGGAFIVNLSFILEKLDVLRFLRVIGYHSLYIYVIHLMITSFTRTFFVRILDITYVPLILVASMITGILIPIIFYNLAMRLNGWWLFSSRAPAATASGLSRKPGFFAMPGSDKKEKEQS